MSEEKMGGYEAQWTKRALQRRNNEQAYENGFAEGNAESFPENVETGEFLLSSIDKRVLTEVFLEDMKKSGVAADQMNTSVLERIWTRPADEESSAFYNSFLNAIAISSNDENFLRIKESRAAGHEVPVELLYESETIFRARTVSCIFRRANTYEG